MPANMPITNAADLQRLRKDYELHRPETFVGDFDLTEADRQWLLRDPLALLSGIIADQSVPATRAWQLPGLLVQRIGQQNFNAAWLAAHEAELLVAIQTKPALHRFPATMARNLVSLGETLISKAHGDAAQLLAIDDFDELEKRLILIKGVGPKKINALSLVMTLDMHLKLKHVDHTQALFDVHLARILGQYLGKKVTPVIATAFCRQLDPDYPALVSPYLWRLDRQRQTLNAVIGQ